MFDLPLLALATWRLSSMLVNEVGPFDIFQRLRDALKVYPAEQDGAVICKSDGAAFGMFCCVWCMSVWCSAVLLALYPYAPVVIWWLAISALAIVLQEIVQRVQSFVRPA